MNWFWRFRRACRYGVDIEIRSPHGRTFGTAKGWANLDNIVGNRRPFGESA